MLCLAMATSAYGQERLCDNAFEDCRAPILQLIQNENVGIDVSFWFMTDSRYSQEIIKRWQAGVPVRVLLDLRADGNYPANANIRQTLISYGIPIRHKTTTGINHWKMMLYAGQAKVHFTAANFANGSYSPIIPYTNYVDEAVYFTDDPTVVHSFMKKYDDLWTDTIHFQNLANINAPLTRSYPELATYTISPDLNFPPDQDYQDRVVAQLKLETTAVDASMFRITSAKIPDELIRRVQAGVPVRLITDQDQYRNTTYFWDSYNVDRMYMAGVDVKWKDHTSGQDMHQKSIVLHGRQLAVFGSSNWTSSSSDTQREHNYFSKKPWFIDWFVDQFNRKWNNLKVDGSAISPPMFLDFDPGWPEQPVNVSPQNAALGVASSVALRWEGGWWAHKYDIYFGTTNPPPLVAQDYMPGSATAGVSSNKESFNPCTPPAPFTSLCPSGLAPGTTYYWRVRGKTMVGNARAISGQVWSFTTSGGVPAPPAPGNLQATAVSSTRIDLSWADVAGEEGYKIERKLASASSTAWTQIATTGANVVSYQNTSGLTPNTAYNYRVRAWTTGGNSGYSNTATATTQASSPATARIVADAYVRAGQYANTNYGTAAELIAKLSVDSQYQREAYLKLDISSVQSGDSVRLRLSGRLSDTRAASVTTRVYAVANTSWAETSLNWNNRPAAGTTILGTIVVSGTSAKWYEVDLTSHVQAQKAAGATVIAITLKNPVDTPPYSAFSSRESGAPPELVASSSTPDGASAIVADAYVRGGAFASTSFGTALELIAKFAATADYHREAYLKLDISDVQPGDTVRLRLAGRLSDTRAATVTTAVHAVDDTSWAETDLNWNNRPPSEAPVLGTIVVGGTSAQWYELDLTDHVQARKTAGATVIAVALKNTADTLPYSAFSSRESGNAPQLVIQD
jgi:phosphatidylserine/phosphatidylglycerophosphate/cardiolipin synthase-like enzyme